MQLEGSTTMSHAPTERAPNGQGEQSQVEQAKEQAKEKVQEASGQARDRVREQVDQRSTQAGERVTSVAQDARSVGEELRRQGKDQPARLADQAADRAERLGSYLQESDADRILRDVEELGRKQPWAVAAGGLALGFVASRFLKASSQRRYSSQPPARY
jgi:vacuolar-type H+-ATPase subunit H